MKIQFYGGVHEVTGSAHMLITDKSRVLRDAGMFQGRRAEAREKNTTTYARMPHPDAVVLSHAHIDHAGNLPMLVKNGFTGPIHLTHPTAEICTYMLSDSAHIQNMDAAFLNKKRAKDDAPPVEPLYTQEDVDKTCALFRPHNYDEKVQITEDIHVTAYDAGHILGAALHIFDITENSHTHRIGYAFDLGRHNMPIIRNPVQLQEIDTLVIEATYGKRVHDDIGNAENLLADVVNRTHARDGKVIIPSFALERSQELLFVLARLRVQQRIPSIPVYLDSPLAANVTDVFRRHDALFDRETQELIKSGDDFLGDNVTYTRSVEESKKLNDLDGPAIIISASGMCEAGRILHHLKNHAPDERNTVLFVGYQAEHTLGRRIIEGEPVIKVFGQKYPMNAEVAVLNTFSGHADKNDLISFVDNTGVRCKTFILVHGEDNALGAFGNLVRHHRPQARIEIPTINEIIEL